MSDVYTTRQLVRVIDDLVRPSSFLLDTFFPFVQNFDTEMIDFDLIAKGKTLAPFVSPLVAGKPQLNRGFTTKSFKPAYIKPKTTVDPTRPMKRRPGEKYTGEMSPMARRDAVVADIFSDHMEQIIRRKEWMAASALVNGQVIVEGEDFPKQVVDYNRDASLSVTLAPASQWGDVGVKVLDLIEDWSGLVATACGAKATTVVLDPLAWKLARADADFKAILDVRRQTSGDVELGPVSRSAEELARYVGNIGDFDFWVYQDTYVDEAGNPQNMLPDNTCIIGGSQIEGVQAHGAIMDPRAGYQSLEFFPTNWISDDPVAEWAMTQSSPLVVPSRPNASFRATVA